MSTTAGEGPHAQLLSTHQTANDRVQGPGSCDPRRIPVDFEDTTKAASSWSAALASAAEGRPGIGFQCQYPTPHMGPTAPRRCQFEDWVS